MLCAQLAAHYNTDWCPEYAREYLLKNGINYTYADLLVIAKSQVAMEEQFISLHSISAKSNAQSLAVRSELLFIDTDMYVMKVWCEFVFGNCHRYILDQIVERKYDLYLLCNTDLPWVKDELREYPDLELRKKLFAIYKDILVNQQVPWVEISGNFEERFATAVQAVEQVAKSNWKDGFSLYPRDKS